MFSKTVAALLAVAAISLGGIYAWQYIDAGSDYIPGSCQKSAGCDNACPSAMTDEAVSETPECCESSRGTAVAKSACPGCCSDDADAEVAPMPRLAAK